MDWLKPTPGNIPDKLKQSDQWVLWRAEQRDGKKTKVPYNAKTGRYAKNNDSETWCSFDDAVQTYQAGEYTGIGFVLTQDSPLCGIDLDHCVDPETGKIDEWALKIVSVMDSYSEVSPSGEGLRIFFEGELPEGGRKKGNVEMYESGRYLTVTGQCLNGRTRKINKRPKQAARVHKKVFVSEKPQGGDDHQYKPAEPSNDMSILEKSFSWKNGPKYLALFNGDTSRYNSHSEADQALCNHLGFLFQNNAARMDAMFRQSGLMREKWDKKHNADGRTYGQLTIDNAIAGNSRCYQEARSQDFHELPREPEIKIVTAEDILNDDPQIDPLIENYLNKGEGVIIHAKGGVGKSMLSLYQSSEAARDQFGYKQYLFDEFEIKRTLTSLFIQSENSSAAVNTRLRAMVGDWNEVKTILRRLFFPQVYGDILTTGKSFEDSKFIDHCVQMTRIIEDQIESTLDLLVVDPLISFHAGEENDAGRMRACLDGVTEITQRTNATPIVLHHDNRNGDYRGSSAVYDWARNMVSLKRVWIGEDRITDFANDKPIKRTAKVPAIEIQHEKANNIPLFASFTVAMDHRFRFQRVSDPVDPETTERCTEVQQALKDLGGYAKSNLALAKTVSELTGRGQTTCKADIAKAVQQEYIIAEQAKEGNANAYCYHIEE